MEPVVLRALDAAFPPELRYPRGPEVIEAIGPLAGCLDSLGPCVTIVGTRRPHPEAWRYAHWLAATLAAAGATILSGGAYGIDAAAHEGALSVGGKTIAVLPGSLRSFVPAGNSALFRRVARSGALIAILPEGSKPRFHERNAILAALASDTVVVAAGAQSGARNTAREAARFGRRLWIVPGAPWEPSMDGCALELATHGRPLVSPLPLAQLLGLPAATIPVAGAVVFERPWSSAPYDPNPAPPRRPRIESQRPDSQVHPARPSAALVTGPLPAASASSAPRRRASTVAQILPAPDELSVLTALRDGPRTADALAVETGLPVGPLRALLLTWTVEGVLREGPPGLFQLSSC